MIGYDDTSLAATRLISLTTVDDRSFDVGERAGGLLRARMGDDDAFAPLGAGPVRTTLPARVVTRSTTARPRSSD